MQDNQQDLLEDATHIGNNRFLNKSNFASSVGKTY
jgi:hypothetical protein